MIDWHTKPPKSVRSVDDAMNRAEQKRNDLPFVVQVYARDWDLVILADEILQQKTEIEALKDKLAYAIDTVDSIVWKDRKPFDEDGWASVSFSALAKGADFLVKVHNK